MMRIKMKSESNEITHHRMVYHTLDDAGNLVDNYRWEEKGDQTVIGISNQYVKTFIPAKKLVGPPFCTPEFICVHKCYDKTPIYSG